MRQDLIELRDAICFGYASKHDLKNAKREDIVAIKSDPELVQYRFVASDTVIKEADTEDRRVVWRASDETPDSYGDIVRVKGWDLERYSKNGQILFGHDRSGLPLAKGKAWKHLAAKGGGALMVQGDWFEEGVNEFADGVLRIIKAGGLPGTSVGFRAGAINDPSDAKEREALGLGPWGLEFTDGHELLENSVVTVPANPNALQERCLKAIDGELERWLRTGEKTPSFVREFRKAVTLTAEELRERLRDQKRKSVVVPELPETKGGLLVPKEVSVKAIEEGAQREQDWLRGLQGAEGATENQTFSQLVERATGNLPQAPPPPLPERDLIDELRGDKQRLSRTVDHLLAQTSRLETTNEQLRAKCAELEQTVTELRASGAGQSQQPSGSEPCTERDAQRGDGTAETSSESAADARSYDALIGALREFTTQLTAKR